MRVSLPYLPQDSQAVRQRRAADRHPPERLEEPVERAPFGIDFLDDAVEDINVKALANGQARRLAEVKPRAALGEIEQPEFLLKVGRFSGQPLGIGPPTLPQEFQAPLCLLIQLPARAGIGPDQPADLLLGDHLAGGEDVLNLVHAFVGRQHGLIYLLEDASKIALASPVNSIVRSTTGSPQASMI